MDLGLIEISGFHGINLPQQKTAAGVQALAYQARC